MPDNDNETNPAIPIVPRNDTVVGTPDGAKTPLNALQDDDLQDIPTLTDGDGNDPPPTPPTPPTVPHDDGIHPPVPPIPPVPPAPPSPTVPHDDGFNSG